MGEPREGVGDGLGEKVIGHGGQVGPGGVAAEKFDEAGTEHEPEEEEPGGETEQGGRNIASGSGGKQARFFEKDDEETGFEEESVPLEGEEVLADVDEGEPAEPSYGGGKGSEQSKGEQGGEDQAGDGDKVKRGVGRAEYPGEGGQGPECSGGTEGFRSAGEEILGRKNAILSIQTWDLGQEGKKGEEVGEAGEAGQKPEAEGVIQGKLILTILLSRESRMILQAGARGVGLTRK